MLLFMVLENPEDRDLFEWAYREYARMLKGTAYRILNDKDEAEDAVQDVFVRLMDFPERLRRIPEEEILPFLTTCTRNRALDILKKKGRVLEISYEDSFETLGETESEESDLIIWVKEEMAKMPEEQRLILQLHFFWGLNYKEIGRQLGKNPATVQKTAIRAIREMQKRQNGGLR
ncbi:MAG: sigma-70 family RNA polymerase sigma factor [Lachnospiraceae bacterium]|nr:sigma-70 family RNA polymerase sigma factor [Lachnospiraceae bacterium]